MGVSARHASSQTLLGTLVSRPPRTEVKRRGKNAGETPALPGRMDSRFRGNDEDGGGTPAFPGSAVPREAPAQAPPWG